MSVQWENIAASAIVAALVTIIIEFSIKPYIEIRKERLLKKERDRDLILEDISIFRHTLTTHQSRIATLGNARGNIESLHEEGASLQKRLHILSGSLPREIYQALEVGLGVCLSMVVASGVVARYVEEKYGKHLDSKEIDKTIEETSVSVIRLCQGAIDLPLQYVNTPWYNFAKKRLLIKEAEGWTVSHGTSLIQKNSTLIVDERERKKGEKGSVR